MIRIQNDLAPNRTVQIFVGVVTVFTALGLAYFAVTGLVKPAALVPGGDAEAAKIFAGYMAARNVVLSVAAVALLGRRAWRALALVLVLNAGVQVLDTLLGLIRGDVAATVGPALISVALIAAMIVLLRQSAAVAQPAIA